MSYFDALIRERPILLISSKGIKGKFMDENDEYQIQKQTIQVKYCTLYKVYSLCPQSDTRSFKPGGIYYIIPVVPRGCTHAVIMKSSLYVDPGCKLSPFPNSVQPFQHERKTNIIHNTHKLKHE